jgi:predicted SprT family Zn-dependent metalloprotease
MQRDSIQKLFNSFNRRVFEGKLKHISIKVRKMSDCVAMFDYNDNCIVLDPIILKREQDLRETLLHEMCHAAVYVIDRNDREMHGYNFFKWACKAYSIYPHHKITIYHYEPSRKYKYICCCNHRFSTEKSLIYHKKGCLQYRFLQ